MIEYWRMNGIYYKAEQQSDCWWNVWGQETSGEWYPVISAKTLQKVKEYTYLIEPITVPFEIL